MLGAWHINLLHSSSISSCILRQKNISDTSMLIQGFLDSWPRKEGIQKELAEQIFLRISKRSFRERFIAHNLIFLEVKNLEVGDGHMAQIQEMPCRSHRRYLHLPKDPLGLFQGGLRRPPTEVTKNTIAEGTNDCYQLSFFGCPATSLVLSIDCCTPSLCYLGGQLSWSSQKSK